MEQRLKSLIIAKLREASRYWPPKKKARDAAKVKVEIGKFKNGKPKTALKYKCNSCAQLFDREDTHMDHIEPVIDPLIGFQDWNTYIFRLFVMEDKFQCLCSNCHKDKTKKENEVRKKIKKGIDTKQ